MRQASPAIRRAFGCCENCGRDGHAAPNCPRPSAAAKGPSVPRSGRGRGPPAGHTKAGRSEPRGDRPPPVPTVAAAAVEARRGDRGKGPKQQQQQQQQPHFKAQPNRGHGQQPNHGGRAGDRDRDRRGMTTAVAPGQRIAGATPAAAAAAAAGRRDGRGQDRVRDRDRDRDRGGRGGGRGGAELARAQAADAAAEIKRLARRRRTLTDSVAALGVLRRRQQNGEQLERNQLDKLGRELV